jgi:hypothetical protein
MTHASLDDSLFLAAFSEQLHLSPAHAQELLQRIRFCERRGIFRGDGQPNVRFSFSLTMRDLIPPSGALLPWNVKASLCDHETLTKNIQTSLSINARKAVRLKEAIQYFAEHGLQVHGGSLSSALALHHLRLDLEQYCAEKKVRQDAQNEILEATDRHSALTLGDLRIFARAPTPDDSSRIAIAAALEAEAMRLNDPNIEGGLDLPLYQLLGLRPVYGLNFERGFVVDWNFLPLHIEPDHVAICRGLRDSAMTQPVAVETLRYAVTLVQRLLIALYNHIVSMPEEDMCVELFSPGYASPFDEVWERLAVAAGGELSKALRRIRWHAGLPFIVVLCCAVVTPVQTRSCAV